MASQQSEASIQKPPPTSSLQPDSPQRLATDHELSEEAVHAFLFGLTKSNAAFSSQTPGLQLVWDSSSLTPLMECPYKYFLKNICGWAPHGNHRSVHLIFGIAYTSGCETYDRARASKVPHRSALRLAVRRVIELCGSRDADGNWLVWNSPDPNKNLPNCLRTLIVYLDRARKDKTIRTLRFSDGTAAVEKRFEIVLDRASAAGEFFALCGYLDRLVQFGAGKYVADHKTTKNSLDDRYFRNFDHSLQMYIYDTAGQIVFSEPLEGGVLIEGAQAAVGFSETRRGLTSRNDYQRQQVVPMLAEWLETAERYAHNARWPRNFTACGHYSGCDYIEHCHARSDLAATAVLRSKFKRVIWDPTKDRED